MLIIKSQQNNWSYVLVVAGITFIVAGFILYYANETMLEIRALSSPDRYQINYSEK